MKVSQYQNSQSRSSQISFACKLLMARNDADAVPYIMAGTFNTSVVNDHIMLAKGNVSLIQNILIRKNWLNTRTDSLMQMEARQLRSKSIRYSAWWCKIHLNYQRMTYDGKAFHSWQP